MSRLIKFFIYVFIIFGLIFVAVGIFATVPPQQLTNIQEKIDALWWAASMVRWFVLAFLVLFFLPWFFKRQSAKYERKAQFIQAELQQAEKCNASYETIVTIKKHQLDAEKFFEFYQHLLKHRLAVGLGLIIIELLIVQLPHHL